METLKCSSCGATLQVDFDEKYITCEFCSSTNVNPHARAKNHLEELKDNDIDRGYAYIKNGNFVFAFQEFKDFSERNPNDYRGYWGMVTALTHEFDYFDIPHAELNDAKKYYEKALIAANKEQRKKIEDIWGNYLNKLQSRSEAHQKKMQDAFNMLSEKNDDIVPKDNKLKELMPLIGSAVGAILNAAFIIYLLSSNVGMVLAQAETFSPIFKVFIGLFINIIATIILCLVFKSELCGKMVLVTPIVFGIITSLFPLFHCSGCFCTAACEAQTFETFLLAFVNPIIIFANLIIIGCCYYISDMLCFSFKKD